MADDGCVTEIGAGRFDTAFNGFTKGDLSTSC
jgi:hypothetical protein